MKGPDPPTKNGSKAHDIEYPVHIWHTDPVVGVEEIQIEEKARPLLLAPGLHH